MVIPPMKRDVQGKFILKDEAYRAVRSLRLTDPTWEALGVKAESLGITRADLLEQMVRNNAGSLPGITRLNDHQHPSNTWQAQPTLPSITRKTEEILPSITRVKEEIYPGEVQHLNQENVLPKAQINSSPDFTELEVLRGQILYDLKLGKQAPGHQVAKKALNRFISYLRSRP